MDNKDSEKYLIPQFFDRLFKALTEDISSLALVASVNGLYGVSHPLDSPVSFPPTETISKLLTLRRADLVTQVAESRYLTEFQLKEGRAMARRVFEYGFQHGSKTWDKTARKEVIRFPAVRVIYLEGGDRVPEKETLQMEFPGGTRYEYAVETLRLLSHSLLYLEERGLGLLLPFYMLKFRRRMRRAKTPGTRRALMQEVVALNREIEESLERLLKKGLLTKEDYWVLLEHLDLITEEVYGKYREFKEAKMQIAERTKPKWRQIYDEVDAKWQDREAKWQDKEVTWLDKEAKWQDQKTAWQTEKSRMEAEIKALKAQLSGGGDGSPQ